MNITLFVFGVVIVVYIVSVSVVFFFFFFLGGGGMLCFGCFVLFCFCSSLCSFVVTIAVSVIHG